MGQPAGKVPLATDAMALFEQVLADLKGSGAKTANPLLTGLAVQAAPTTSNIQASPSTNPATPAASTSPATPATSTTQATPATAAASTPGLALPADLFAVVPESRSSQPDGGDGGKSRGVDNGKTKNVQGASGTKVQTEAQDPGAGPVAVPFFPILANAFAPSHAVSKVNGKADQANSTASAAVSPKADRTASQAAGVTADTTVGREAGAAANATAKSAASAIVDTANASVMNAAVDTPVGTKAALASLQALPIPGVTVEQVVGAVSKSLSSVTHAPDGKGASAGSAGDRQNLPSWAPAALVDVSANTPSVPVHPVSQDSAIQMAAQQGANANLTGVQPQLGQQGLQQAAQATQNAYTIPLPVKSDGWDGAFGQRIVWMLGHQTHWAQISLNPPDLGSVDVRLSIHGNEAGAQFFSPHAAAREAIEAALPRLREMMSEAGLSLGQAQVSADSFTGAGRQDGQAYSPWIGRGGSGSLGGETMIGAVSHMALGIVDLYV